MEEKELKAKDIPMGYARCFNDACKRRDTCMHYLANVLTNQQWITGSVLLVIIYENKNLVV